MLRRSGGRGETAGVEEAGARMGGYRTEPEVRLVCVHCSLVETEGCQFDCGYHACYVSVSLFFVDTARRPLSLPPQSEVYELIPS